MINIYIKQENPFEETDLVSIGNSELIPSVEATKCEPIFTSSKRITRKTDKAISTIANLSKDSQLVLQIVCRIWSTG